MSHALTHWRGKYPILERCTYLASHSLGAVPASTEETLRRYHEEWATLGILAWDGPWWQAVLDFEADMEAILNANAGTVVPMQNATRGMAAVASCFDYRAGRDKVILTDLEFTTSYPFWRAQEDYGARVEVIESDDGVTVPTEKIINAIDETTLLLPLSHVYFRSGAVQDLGAITSAAHKSGAMVLGDGYQAVGTLPVDVQALGVDFYVGGSHKWLCGGAGAAFLYVHPDHIQNLLPRLTGWFGLEDPFSYTPGASRPAPNSGIHRFLGGTPNVPALYAARDGIRNVREIGVEKIRMVSRQLTEYAKAQAIERGLTLRSPARFEARSGMLCLNFSGAQQCASSLEAQKIIVDWRPDCGIRISPHFYNSVEDLNIFFEALDKLR